MISREAWTWLSHTALWLKYVFTGATTILTVVSLRYETTYKTDDPTARKRLTFVGGYYQTAVILLAAITLATTIAGDLADNHVKKFEKDDEATALDIALQSALETQAREKIAPIMKVFSEQLTTTSSKVSGDVEQQGKRSLQQLKAVEDDLATQATQSSKELTKVQTSMLKASQETTREIVEKQQNLTEANRGLLNFDIVLSFGPGEVDAAQMNAWRDRAMEYTDRQLRECKDFEARQGNGVWSYVCDEATKRAAQNAPMYAFASELYSNDPEVTNSVFIMTPAFAFSINDQPCETTGRRDQLVAQGMLSRGTKDTPCVDVPTGTLTKKFLRNGVVIPPTDLALTLGPSPTGRPTDVVIASSLDQATREKWSLQAQDLTINALIFSTCKTFHAVFEPHVNTAGMPERLKTAASRLPAVLNMSVLKMLSNPASDLRADPSNHFYEYRKVENSTSLVPGGCLNTTYTAEPQFGQR